MGRTRWIIAASVALVAVVTGVWGTFFRGPSAADCKPVVEMLEFNKSQAALISSKTGDAATTVPTVAEDAAYQQWADGLAQRAEKVSNPDLQAQAVQLSDLATQFVAKLPRLRSETAARAPDAPAPSVAFEMAVLNDKITGTIGELSKACPG